MIHCSSDCIREGEGRFDSSSHIGFSDLNIVQRDAFKGRNNLATLTAELIGAFHRLQNGVAVTSSIRIPAFNHFPVSTEVKPSKRAIRRGTGHIRRGEACRIGQINAIR